MDGESQLIRALERVLGDNDDAERALSAIVDVINAEVGRGGRVAIPGFGVFSANPRSREGQATVRFHPSPKFRAQVNGGMLPKAETRTDVLRLQHFEIPRGVSLSALLPEGLSRCGIYVLHFENGYRYVGQALDVLSRFAAHRRFWDQPIVGIEFAPVTADQLNLMERRVLQSLERQGCGCTTLRSSGCRRVLAHSISLSTGSLRSAGSSGPKTTWVQRLRRTHRS